MASEETIRALLNEQRRYFRTGATLPVSARIQALSRLEQLRADKREEWVKTITDRVLGREA